MHPCSLFFVHNSASQRLQLRALNENNNMFTYYVPFNKLMRPETQRWTLASLSPHFTPLNICGTWQICREAQQQRVLLQMLRSQNRTFILIWMHFHPPTCAIAKDMSSSTQLRQPHSITGGFCLAFPPCLALLLSAYSGRPLKL